MGMYDNIMVDKIHLPEEIKNQETDWQTKSINCELANLFLSEDGYLFVTREENGEGDKKFLDDFIGELRFYKHIKNVWYEFVGFVVKGQLKILIQIHPKNDTL